MSMPTLIKFIRSDNTTFIIGTGSNWKITSLSGIDYPNISVFSEKNGVGDGAISTGKRVNDRDVQVIAKSIDPKINATIRKQAIAFFNPKYTYKLYVTYLGRTRWIEGEIEGFSCPATNVYRTMKLTIRFLCNDPFFKSVDDFGVDIASKSPSFGFPYIECLNPLIPVIADVYNYAQTVIVTNDGDTETYAKAIITFNGEATGPTLYKDESYVRVIGTFDIGDELVIDFENSIIRKNGEPIMQYIDRTSSFTDMGIEIGDNEIGFSADSGDSNMSVVIYYYKRYLGV